MVAAVGNDGFGFDGGMVVEPATVSFYFNHEFPSGKAVLYG